MQNAIGDLKLVLATLTLGAVVLGDLSRAAEPGIVGAGPAAEYLPREIENTPTGFPGFYMEPRPRWYFNVEAVALKRDAYNDLSFSHLIERVWTESFDDATPPNSLGWDFVDTETPVLGTNNLIFDFAGGGRAVVGRTLGDWYSVEASYMGLNSWDEFGAVADATEFIVTADPVTGATILSYLGSLFSPFSGFGDPVAVPEFDYNTGVASILVGGRFTTVEERFTYHSDSNVPAAGTTVDVNTSTNNYMLGVQVGAMFEFQVEPAWWVDAEIKGVLFDNLADQTTNFVYNEPAVAAPGTTVVRDYAHSDNVSSFGLDVRLMFTCKISRCLSGRIGYQALWLDGVALASENVPRNWVSLVNGPVLLNNNPGRVVYHGPSIGLMGEW